VRGMGRTRDRLRIVACGALLAIAASACTPQMGPRETSPTPPPSTPPCDREADDAWGLFATVTDPSGAPIEGAVVELVSGDFFGNARSTAEGKFGAPCVWGLFEVSVAHLEYTAASRTVVVDPGERREITFELEPLRP
jgi:hypothetical protein